MNDAEMSPGRGVPATGSGLRQLSRHFVAEKVRPLSSTVWDARKPQRARSLMCPRQLKTVMMEHLLGMAHGKVHVVDCPDGTSHSLESRQT